MKLFKNLALSLSLVAAVATVTPQKAEAGVILMSTSTLTSMALSAGNGVTEDVLFQSLRVGGVFLLATVAVGGIIAMGDNENPAETFKYALILGAESQQTDVEGILMAKYPFLDDEASVSRLATSILSKIESLEDVNYVRLSAEEVLKATASANLSKAESSLLVSDLK